MYSKTEQSELSMPSTDSDHSLNKDSLRIALFGKEAATLLPLLEPEASLTLVQEAPDVVICYGGDGTLLAAELEWPGIPKVPVLNSKRGNRCIQRRPEEVISALVQRDMVETRYTKLFCKVFSAGCKTPAHTISCLNEINVHMGRINSAVRFQLSINSIPFEEGVEIVSDGFVVCTAFGSNAYFKAITKGIFTEGIGVAFKATTHPVNHIVLPEESRFCFVITRGPATLAFDNSPEYVDLEEGDRILVCRHTDSATILTCDPVTKLDEPF
jgi:NAD kinase